jgi:heat shock protein HslJ
MFVLESSQGFEPVAGTTVRLSFHDGSLSMHAGCNTHSGDYAVQDGVLLFENVATTEIGCDPALHTQDMLLADFLTSKPRLHLDGDRLTLSSSKMTLVFLDRETADPDRPLVGTVWEVDTFIEGDGASNLPLATEPTMVFGDDGVLQVDTTCNMGSGHYTVDGNRMLLSDMSYTDASCSGASAVAESRMQAVLRDGTLSFEIEARRLTLDRGSTGLAALARE